MNRLSTALVLVSFSLPSLFGPAHAQVSAPLSTIPECISMSVGPRFAGNPIGGYTVTVRDVFGVPVPGAVVTLTFMPGADAMVAWCVGQAHPFIGPVATNAVGMATLEIHGGGCISDPALQACGLPAADLDVFNPVDGSFFKVPLFCVNSPDAVDAAGLKPACPPTNTCDGPAPGVSNSGLVDAVYHGGVIKLGLVDPCTQFAPPYAGAVNLADAVFLVPYIKTGSVCVCQ